MNLVNKLIEQCKNPKGLLGSFLLGIMNTTHTRMTKWALTKTSISKDAVILDIGCGGGKTIETLSKIAIDGKLYGIDYSDKSVENSIRKNMQGVKSGNVTICQASVSSIPFAKDFFDLITAIQTHYFWPDLEHDLAEVFRVLNQIGCFMLVSEVYKINYHMTHYKTREEYEHLLRKIGFKSVNCYQSSGWICFVAGKKHNLQSTKLTP